MRLLWNPPKPPKHLGSNGVRPNSLGLVPGPFLAPLQSPQGLQRFSVEDDATPNLPTKIIPTKIACLKLSGTFPLGMRIPPLKTKIMLESNTLESRIFVRRLAAWRKGRASLAAGNNNNNDNNNNTVIVIAIVTVIVITL